METNQGRHSKSNASPPAHSIKKVLGVVLMELAVFFAFIAAVAGNEDATSAFLVIDLILFVPGAHMYYRVFNPKMRKDISIPPVDPNKPLTPVPATGIVLKPGEVCYLVSNVQSAKVKEVTTGYSGKRSGVSLKVTKGLTLHSGGSKGTPIRKRIVEKWPGTLYVTNNRIILNASHYGFNKPIISLDSYHLYTDGINFQFGSTPYLIMTKNPEYVISVIKAAINQH